MMDTIKKILLIDDNPEEQHLFKEAVSRVSKEVECYYADSVVNAFLLLESMKGGLPDIIFLDINMPLHNGRDGLKALKLSKRFSHIPVVMYTIQDLTHQKAELREIGASFSLQKPELRELVLILRFLLGERQTTADLEDVEKLFLKFA
jgi:DNA-binding response OmpR family regulator